MTLDNLVDMSLQEDPTFQDWLSAHARQDAALSQHIATQTSGRVNHATAWEADWAKDAASAKSAADRASRATNQATWAASRGLPRSTSPTPGHTSPPSGRLILAPPSGCLTLTPLAQKTLTPGCNPSTPTSRRLYPHGVPPRSACLSLLGGAPASGGAVSPTPDTTNHRWDLATGGDAGDVAASGGAVLLVATDVQTTMVVGDSAVSEGAHSTTVPLSTANPFDTVDNDAAHDGAWLDKDAVLDGAHPPPLPTTLTDTNALGAAPENAFLNNMLGAVDEDLISATLTAADVDEDAQKVRSLCNSSTCGSTMQDIISPLAVAIAQADAHLDVLLELDVPSTAISAPTALDHNPNLKSILTLILSSLCNLSNILREIGWLHSNISQVQTTMMSLASRVHSDIEKIKSEVDAIKGEMDMAKAELD
jgi:hypothetical protein